MKFLTQFILSVTLLILKTALPAYSQDTNRESLNLNGASALELMSNESGSFVYLSAEGPLGLFYSVDFGRNWSDARGGEYDGGQVAGMTLTDDEIFFVRSGNSEATVFVTNILTIGGWSEIDIDEFETGDLTPTAITTDGTYVFIGTRESQVIVINASTHEFVDSSLVPVAQGFSTGQINYLAVNSDTNFLFAQTGLSTGNNSSLYRATYNTNTGQITTNTWSEKKPSTTGTHRVYVSPNNLLYVTTFSGNAYQSNDNGNSYSTITLSGGGQGASFSGNTHLVGNSLSNDGGTTFTDISNISGDVTERNGKAVLLHPGDSFIASQTPRIKATSRALISTFLGVARTNNLDQITASTWQHSNAGLEGVIANAMAQNPDNKDRVVLATNSGIAFTNNFTADSIDWEFPIRPLDQGLNASAAIFHPTNNNRVFVADTDIYVGTIGGNGAISWDTIRRDDTPSGRTEYGFVTSMTFLENESLLAVTWTERFINALSGKLSFVNPSTGIEVRSALVGKPVQSFVAVSESVMYAGVGAKDTTLDGAELNANRGIYRSTDGGVTWSKMTDSELLIQETEFLSLAYDAESDTLFCGLREFEQDDDEDDVDDDVDNDEDDEDEGEDEDGTDQGGAVLMLENASTDTPTWRVPVVAPSSDREYGSIAIDSITSNIYISAGKYLYRSADRGASWSTFYEGLESESTSMLFFDDLVQGSNTGVYNLSASTILSPAYVPWNGYAGNNVLELGNTGAESIIFSIQLYDISGTAQGFLPVFVPAKSQIDVLLNLLDGFSSTSYGVARVTWSGDGASLRIANYRAGASGQDYVRSSKVETPITGESYTIFNTINPSLTATDSSNQIEQWLTIINVDPENSHTFTLNRYNAAGTVVHTQQIVLAPFARTDIDGGLSIPGAGTFGLNQITPDDSTAPYLSFLVRLAQDRSTNAYRYSMLSLGTRGTGLTQWSHISTGGGASCYVELANVGSSAATVTLTYHSDRDTSFAQTVSLPALSQQHFNACGFLNGTATGAVSATPGSVSNQIILQSTAYFYDSEGIVQSAYLEPGSSALQRTTSNSWNLNIEMYNWLRLYNVSNSTNVLTIATYNNSTGLLQQHSFGLTPHHSIDIDLHNVSLWGTSSNAYGLVTINGTEDYLADILRIRLDSTTGGLDFITSAASQ